MVWIHDTGYGPAYAHAGYAAAVVLDGFETGGGSGQAVSEVIGWRSACACGWRGTQFHSRSEWISRTGLASDGIDAWKTASGAFAEWQRHVRRDLPELAVHDLSRQLADAQNRLRDAVRAARLAGLPWSRIGAAAGATPTDAWRQWATTDPS